jgi:hypothetical protein
VRAVWSAPPSRRVKKQPVVVAGGTLAITQRKLHSTVSLSGDEWLTCSCFSPNRSTPSDPGPIAQPILEGTILADADPPGPAWSACCGWCSGRRHHLEPLLHPLAASARQPVRHLGHRSRRASRGRLSDSALSSRNWTKPYVAAACIRRSGGGCEHLAIHGCSGGEHPLSKEEAASPGASKPRDLTGELARWIISAPAPMSPTISRHRSSRLSRTPYLYVAVKSPSSSKAMMRSPTARGLVIQF